MPQKLSHEADPKHVPDVVYVSPMEMKPNRVFIGLIAGAIILTIGITGAYLINNFVLTDTISVSPVEIKKASPSATATPSAQKESDCGNDREVKHQELFRACLPGEFKYSKYDANKNFIFFSKKPVTSTDEFAGHIVVEVLDKSLEAELAEINECCTKESETKVTIDTIQATQQTGKEFSTGNPIIKTIFTASGKTYEIVLIGRSQQDFEEQKGAYDNFISTFKFLP